VLPKRVRAAAVVSGPAPPFVLPGGLDRIDEEDRGLIDLALRDLDAVRERMEARGDWIRDLVANPSRLTVNTEVEADRRVLGDPAIHDLVIRSLREALHQGMEGYARDWLAIRLPWSFAVNEIQTRIEIWHGALDRNVPVEDAEFLAAAIPGAKLTIWPGAGHWAIFPHWEEILSALVA
jgi:pimeloyl-ACP methyl ester carboxylesterase